MTDRSRKYKTDKEHISARDAYELTEKAAADPACRNVGVVLEGSVDEMALFYQAGKHFGLKIVGMLVDGKSKPVTRQVKKLKAREWQAFIQGRRMVDLSDLSLNGITKKELNGKASGSIASPAMQSLGALIGLNEVKEQIEDIGHLMKNRQDRKRAKLPAIEMSQHLVFTGNPGTGKTTVARLVGEIYREFGVLKKGQFVEIDGRGLIAEYVGQTAAKAKEIISEALDGVLFIDEAYALVQGNGSSDFGPEAIATLIKMMEDHRDRLVVIIAGYAEEIEELLNSNPGLKSRFKTKIDFPDYSAEELRDIFMQFCSDKNYLLTKEAKEKAAHLFTKMAASKSEQFGNGRSVRNMFDRCVLNHARRLSARVTPSRKDLQTVKQADIPDLADVEW